LYGTIPYISTTYILDRERRGSREEERERKRERRGKEEKIHKEKRSPAARDETGTKNLERQVLLFHSLSFSESLR
jgi:hypothetical protein